MLTECCVKKKTRRKTTRTENTLKKNYIFCHKWHASDIFYHFLSFIYIFLFFAFFVVFVVIVVAKQLVSWCKQLLKENTVIFLMNVMRQKWKIIQNNLSSKMKEYEIKKWNL